MPPAFVVALSTSSVAVIVVFMLMLVANVLVISSGGFVQFTNSQIAFTHPVYGLPTGYTFAVWGLIYILEGIFCIWQADAHAVLHCVYAACHAHMRGACRVRVR